MESELQQIASNGFCKLPGVYSAEEVSKALALVEEWESRMQDSLSDDVPYLNKKQRMVYNLQNKDTFFLNLILSRKNIQQILIHFLNDKWFRQIPPEDPNYIMRSYLARTSCGALPMHLDSFIPYIGKYVVSMQVLVALDEQTQENGCSLVVPGSHLAGEYVEQSAIDDAIPIESEPGDVVIWDSRLWHGTKANDSGRTRWALIATFARWWLKQAFDIPRSMPEDIYEQLTDSQKAVMGFCSSPNIDETTGIDMKRGYAGLPRSVAALQM